MKAIATEQQTPAQHQLPTGESNETRSNVFLDEFTQMFRNSSMSERASRLSNQLFEDYDMKFAGLEQPFGGSFLRRNELSLSSNGGGSSLTSLYTGTSFRTTRHSLAPMGSVSIDCEETQEKTDPNVQQNQLQPSQSQYFQQQQQQQQQQLISQSQMNGEGWRQNRSTILDPRSRARRSYYMQRHGGSGSECTVTSSTQNTNDS